MTDPIGTFFRPTTYEYWRPDLWIDLQTPLGPGRHVCKNRTGDLLLTAFKRGQKLGFADAGGDEVVVFRNV